GCGGACGRAWRRGAARARSRTAAARGGAVPVRSRCRSDPDRLAFLRHCASWRGLRNGPVGTGQPVEHMPPQRMADRHARMLEIAGRVVAHPEPLHDPPGRLVELRGERHDLLQAELLEAEGDRSKARFGRVAVTPVLAREPPAHFDGGSEVLLEARPDEPDEADEARTADDLDGPQPPALLLDLPTGLPRERVALLA